MSAVPAHAAFAPPAHPIGPQLGAGRVSTIHAFGRSMVLKLYPRTTPLVEIERERDLALAVQRTGLPVPTVQPQLVAMADGRVGIVFGRIEGPRLSEYVRRAPLRVWRAARILADTQRAVHAVANVDGLPSLKDRLALKIWGVTDLSDGDRDRVLAVLDALPSGRSLCHGDLHCENVLVTTNGAVVVDWADATLGRPLADAARSWLTLRFPDDDGLAVRIFCRLLGALTLHEYLRRTPHDPRELAHWKLVCAAARLRETLPAVERAQLVRLVRAGLPR